MNCDVCGKEIAISNQFHINYNGQRMIVCGKHYAQYIKYHKFLDSNPRSNAGMNDFETTKDGTYIFCYNRQNKPSGKFLIDTEDLDRVICKKWRCWKNSYFTGNFNPISITSYLLNPPVGCVVDHINGDTSDNRKMNLRVTTQNKNVLNKAVPSNNHSGIMGVWWDANRKRWDAEIKLDGIKCYLGRYKNIEDAVYARYIAETKLFKQYRSFRNNDVIFDYISKCNRKQDIENHVNKRLQLKFPNVDTAC